LKWAGHVAVSVETIYANKILARKIERRQLGKPRRRWNCSIKWSVKKWIVTVYCVDLAWDWDKWRA